MFTLKGIRHAYEGREVLRLDNWSVGQGESWLILGQSGSGKTTLLHILAGILAPSAGEVSVAGENLDRFSPAELDRFRGRHIGIVFQRLHLIPSLSVIGNLRLAQYLAGTAHDTQNAHRLLKTLGLAEKESSLPKALSFGQSQRAAIARAVVNGPRLILADEPTSNLDDKSALSALDVLLDQAGACDATLVIATHDRRIKERFKHQLTLDDHT